MKLQTKTIPSLLVVALLVFTIAAKAEDAERDPSTNDARDNITQGFKLIDGDIQVPMDFDPEMRMAYNVNLWTNNTVPFEYDANVTQANQTNMQTAMAQWTAISGVTFVARTNQANFVHIQNNTNTNNSAVGMVGGQQIMNIRDWGTTFVVAHELAHCLGLFHEHQRPDRNTYITINGNNVQGGTGGATFLNNFPVEGAAHAYGPYDFDSVMHYGRCAFSTCCPAGSACNCATNCETITVLPPNDTTWQALIGQRTHLSKYDKLIIRMLYRYNGDRFLDRNYSGTQSGTFLQPWNVTVAAAISSTPTNGTLFIQPGAYSAIGTHNKAITITAPIGGVSLGN